MFIPSQVDREQANKVAQRLYYRMGEIILSTKAAPYPGQLENIAIGLEEAKSALMSIGCRFPEKRFIDTGISLHSIELLTLDSNRLLSKALREKDEKSYLTAFADTGTSVSQMLGSDTFDKLISGRNADLLNGELNDATLNLLRLLVDLEGSLPVIQDSRRVFVYHHDIARIRHVLNVFYKLTHDQLTAIFKDITQGRAPTRAC